MKLIASRLVWYANTKKGGIYMKNKTWPWLLGAALLIACLFFWGAQDTETVTWTSEEVEIDGLLYQVTGVESSSGELMVQVRVKNEGNAAERLSFNMKLVSEGKTFEASSVATDDNELRLNPSSRTTMTATFKGSVPSMLESPVLLIEDVELPLSK